MNPLWILLIGMAVVIGGVLVLRLHPFLSLIAAALIVAVITPQPYIYRAAIHAGASDADALKQSHQTIGQRVADGFGATATSVGVLIAMASVVGKMLMETGSAERIVLACRR